MVYCLLDYKTYPPSSLACVPHINAGNLRDSNPDIPKSKIAVFSLKMSTHLVGKPSCAGTVKDMMSASFT